MARWSATGAFSGRQGRAYLSTPHAQPRVLALFGTRDPLYDPSAGARLLAHLHGVVQRPVGENLRSEPSPDHFSLFTDLRYREVWSEIAEFVIAAE